MNGVSLGKRRLFSRGADQNRAVGPQTPPFQHLAKGWWGDGTSDGTSPIGQADRPPATGYAVGLTKLVPAFFWLSVWGRGGQRNRTERGAGIPVENAEALPHLCC